MVSMMGSIPEVSLARRREILALEPTDGAHARLLAELGFDDALEVEPPPLGAPRLAEPLRVVAWNAQRARDPKASASMIASTGASVFLLSELDHGMARSGQRHATREIAARLGCGYAFGVEFLELGLGDVHEREAHAGAENTVGYHGGSILAPRAFAGTALVRFDRSGRWFDGALGERRVGGRIAVLCRLAVGDREVAFASIHLESHSDPDERAAQLGAVFDALEAFAPGAPALVGGDVNTHSLGRAELADRALLARALETDPRRLTEPIRHEPLFALAERRGFEWRACNAVGSSTERRVHVEGSRRGVLALDWFFARGLEVSEPAVIEAVDPEGGAALSDHEAIAITIRPR
jgi:endonuclease/exonuclease/phosphatase family metal-dependent hydrolase